MSYDVHVLRFRNGEAAPAESAEAWELLEAAWEKAPDEFGYCLVRRGGDEGDLYGLTTGKPIERLMFNHAGWGVYQLMYDLATAADMTIVPPDVGPFLVREEQRQHLPADLATRAVVVESGADLVRAITEA